ncbi:hypothetical protein K458DRAFT_486191 [Lentithecium fluviatile CBS 122367]|uniref:Uncharacterized protein n=1 Tax=Lentithecium fluviatile CBS 122367 TaxID=1168545 RepID=A0A6G1J6G7_9PLEO|nr:hypothetical protein K458DRAFT_486191 [Lentithecium fluviatile CBS 122367]
MGYREVVIALGIINCQHTRILIVFLNPLGDAPTTITTAPASAANFVACPHVPGPWDHMPIPRFWGLLVARDDRTYATPVIRAWFIAVQEPGDGAIGARPYLTDVRPLVRASRNIGRKGFRYLTLFMNGPLLLTCWCGGVCRLSLGIGHDVMPSAVMPGDVVETCSGGSGSAMPCEKYLSV